MFDAGEPARSAWLFDAVRSSELAVVVADAAGKVCDWSPGAVALFGVAEGEAIGRTLDELGIADRREGTVARADGTVVAVRTTRQPLFDAGGSVVGVVLVAVDLGERARFEHALLRGALLDPLTRLPNRAVLRDVLSRLRDERRSGATMAVLFVDLDGFKAVNDAHGHAVGDGVLGEVARRLRATVRQGDVVGRLGGDEFVLVCQVGPNPGGAEDLASRVASEVAAPFTVETPDGGAVVRITASVGVAVAAPGSDPDTLLDLADRAMYQAKRRGPGGFQVLTD